MTTPEGGNGDSETETQKGVKDLKHNIRVNAARIMSTKDVGLRVPSEYLGPNAYKGLEVQNDVLAGFLVPEDQRTEIVDRNAYEFDAIRALARVVTTANNSIKFPTRTTHSSAGWVTESGTTTPDTTLAYGMLEIPVKKISMAYDVTREMIEDSDFDIGQLMMEVFEEEFASTEGIAFVAGDGVDEPEGFTVNATVQANYEPTGTDASITSNNFEWVPKLMTQIKAPYQPNGTWVMNRTTLGVFFSNADGESRPYMSPDVRDSWQLRIYGRPIVLSTSMPNIGSNTFPIAFGDFRKGYYIVDKRGLQIQVDPYTQNMTDTVRYVGYKRVGGGTAVPEAIALAKCAAS
jgi:HK97 family phage major capsid protein